MPYGMTKVAAPAAAATITPHQEGPSLSSYSLRRLKLIHQQKSNIVKAAKPLQNISTQRQFNPRILANRTRQGCSLSLSIFTNIRRAGGSDRRKDQAKARRD
jgi:hypothetical protein